MAKFKIGDKVKTKIGGPNMVVNEVNEFTDGVNYVCVWFIGPKVQRERFSEDILMEVVDDGK